MTKKQEIIEGDVKASTNITIDDVVIYIDYPLEIKRGQSELKISKFLDISIAWAPKTPMFFATTLFSDI